MISKKFFNTNIQHLKANLREFKMVDEIQQKEVLVTLLWPLVKQTAPADVVPKITDMLTDLSLWKLRDILEFLEDENVLREMVEDTITVLEQADSIGIGYGLNLKLSI